MFQDYSLLRGGLPAREVEPSSEQLSAVKQLLDLGAPPIRRLFCLRTVRPSDASASHVHGVRLPTRYGGMASPGASGAFGLFGL
eukprot:575660-Lingulodinium_polyedra.AAC.1